MKSFVTKVVERLTIGPANILVGMMTYNHGYKDQWQLKTFAKDKKKLLSAIKNIRYSAGGTRTGSALEFAARKKFTSSSGKRANVPAVTILMTDGRSKDSVYTRAKNLQRVSRVIALGIANANMRELEAIASAPNFVRTVDDFEELESIIELTVVSFCSAQGEIYFNLEYS